MRFVICIFSLSMLVICSANAEQPAPPLAPGAPIPTKFEEITDKKGSLINLFKGREDKERYFVSSVTSDVSKKGSEMLVGPNVNYKSKNVSIFEKILFLEHVDKSPQERAKIKQIKRFLNTNYKTQILPDEAYEDVGIPKPFYLNQLRTWVFDAVHNSDLRTLRALLDNYNLINIKNRDGTGLLSYALMHNNNRIAKFLIRRGADIKEVNKDNNTPLNIAARNNNEIMVNILARSGCDAHHKDISGKSAVDYARIHKNSAMHRSLEGMKH